MLKKQINIVFTCDLGRHTFLDLWFLGVFHSRFWHLLFRSYWKYQVSSSLYCPQKHITLSSFSWKVRINVKSSVFHHSKCMAQSSQHFCFSSTFLLEWSCFMAHKHRKRCSSFLQMRKIKLKLQSCGFLWASSFHRPLLPHAPQVPHSPSHSLPQLPRSPYLRLAEVPSREGGSKATGRKGRVWSILAWGRWVGL